MLLNLKNREEQYLLFLKENDELPNILEHGDLETQNLLVNRITGQIKVLDWVNTRFGSGLVDINQYIENYVEVMAKTDINLEAFEQLYTGYDFHRLLNQTRVLMLLNKINFYAGKILDGIEYSESKKVRNYEMLKKFVVEADLIINSL
jgi:aminoglycoside phosphotransferase (APT) family kinase protein